MLGGSAGDTVEFLNRELEGARLGSLGLEDWHEFTHIDNGLDGPLSEAALVTHHNGTTVILERCREYLAGRGAEAVDQDDDGPRVELAPVVLLEETDAPVGILGLDDRSRTDKETAQGLGLGE